MNRARLFIGRKKPYSAIGIRRMKCASCTQRAEYQWNCCANGNYWVPLCARCDVMMNDLMMRFVNHPHHGKLMKRYRKLKLGA